MKIKFNNGKYIELVNGVGNMVEQFPGGSRSVATMTVTGTNYQDAIQAFSDGASWTVVDDDGTEYKEWETYTKAGPITDNRDGTLTIKMGMADTSEQVALNEAKEAKAAVVTLVGKESVTPEEVSKARESIEAGADALPDEQAAVQPSLSKPWKVGEKVDPGNRRYYKPTDLLYKVREGQGHTTQADWTPDKTPAMWAVIDVVHSGTFDDPIPAARGMDYTYGKYYKDPEDAKVYLCKREGEEDGGIINLQYLPHELIGHYFELATAQW